MLEIAQKTCYRCRQTKSVLDFNRNAIRPLGRQDMCKICQSAYRNDYYARNPDKKLAAQVRALQWNKENKDRRQKTWQKRNLKLLGISQEEYFETFERQGKSCAICKSGVNQHLKQRTFPADHCHKTGKFRGILCHNCNVALGLLKENTEVMEMAIAYLKKHAN